MNSQFNHLQWTEEHMASQSCKAQCVDHCLFFNSCVLVKEEKVQATLVANNPVQKHSGATIRRQAESSTYGSVGVIKTRCSVP